MSGFVIALQMAYRFRPVPNGPPSDYVQTVFRSHARTGVFRRFGSITTNIAHLTLEKFKTVPFPLPPQAEQEEIVKTVQRLFSVTDKAERYLIRERARSSRLRQSILKRAFEGKLVPQDPNDEPASVLLERIRVPGTANISASRARKARRRSRSG